MSAVANASSKNQRPYGSLSQNADGNVIGELAGAGKAVHLAKLVGADGIDFLSGERWQGQQIVQISRPEEVKLVAKEFVGAVGAQAI